MACCYRRVDMMALLLEAGANVHTIDCWGRSLWASVEKMPGRGGDGDKKAAALALLDDYAARGDGHLGEEAERLRKQGPALLRSAAWQLRGGWGHVSVHASGRHFSERAPRSTAEASNESFMQSSWCCAGNAAFADGDYDRALERYAAANAAKPHAYAFANAALIFLRRRQWREAQDAAGKATTLDATYTKAWHRRVQAYVGMRDFPRARMFLNDAIKSVHADDAALPRLRRMHAVLIECGVGDRFSGLGGHERIAQLMQQVERGAAYERCGYCRKPLTLPLSKWGGTCPFCVCDPADARAAQLDAKLAAI